MPPGDPAIPDATGVSPFTPKLSTLVTSPCPKRCCQTRFTITPRGQRVFGTCQPRSQFQPAALCRIERRLTRSWNSDHAQEPGARHAGPQLLRLAANANLGIAERLPRHQRTPSAAPQRALQQTGSVVRAINSACSLRIFCSARDTLRFGRPFGPGSSPPACRRAGPRIRPSPRLQPA